jgi:hypothetical protein
VDSGKLTLAGVPETRHARLFGRSAIFFHPHVTISSSGVYHLQISQETQPEGACAMKGNHIVVLIAGITLATLTAEAKGGGGNGGGTGTGIPAGDKVKVEQQVKKREQKQEQKQEQAGEKTCAETCAADGSTDAQ